jgi:serine O-acetyltransferase
MEVLYPGFARYHSEDDVGADRSVEKALKGLHEKLTREIAQALGSDSKPDPPPADVEWVAQQKASDLLRLLPTLRRVLARDVNAAYEGDPAATSHEEIIYCYPGLEAVTIYRVAHELLLLGVPLIPRMMTELAHSKTGIDIHPGARIGHSFFIDHGTGVVIGETCDIGTHVRLYQGVTLGALTFPRDAAGNLIRGTKRHPSLQDNVVVYANATILGGETVVGHHAVIGSNVWLTQSVPPYAVVAIEKPSLRIVAMDPSASQDSDN